MLAWPSACVLTGCTSALRQLAPTVHDNYWSGKLSIQVFDEPPQTLSASFELSGSRDTGTLVLLNPFGTVAAQAQWTPGHASLVQGTHTRQAASLNALTQDILGAALPLEALFDWLHDKPNDAMGWSADLSARANGKITAHRNNPLPTARLRIVLDMQ